MTIAYKASAEVQFSEIEFGISQMESLLARNQKAKITRKSRRSTAVFVTTAALIALVVVLGVGYHSGWTAETAVPILQIPVPVLIWSFIGSLGAMLYRFNTFADAEMGDPPLVLYPAADWHPDGDHRLYGLQGRRPLAVTVPFRSNYG